LEAVRCRGEQVGSLERNGRKNWAAKTLAGQPDRLVCQEEGRWGTEVRSMFRTSCRHRRGRSKGLCGLDCSGV